MQNDSCFYQATEKKMMDEKVRLTMSYQTLILHTNENVGSKAAKIISDPLPTALFPSIYIVKCFLQRVGAFII